VKRGLPLRLNPDLTVASSHRIPRPNTGASAQIGDAPQLSAIDALVDVATERS
jgi:hypothetical protein